MKTHAPDFTDAIASSLATATHAGILASSISDLVDRIATARQARAAERARLRERARTARIVAELPYDIRADIGWPARYDEESEG